MCLIGKERIIVDLLTQLGPTNEIGVKQKRPPFAIGVGLFAFPKRQRLSRLRENECPLFEIVSISSVSQRITGKVFQCHLIQIQQKFMPAQGLVATDGIMNYSDQRMLWSPGS